MFLELNPRTPFFKNKVHFFIKILSGSLFVLESTLIIFSYQNLLKDFTLLLCSVNLNYAFNWLYFVLHFSLQLFLHQWMNLIIGKIYKNHYPHMTKKIEQSIFAAFYCHWKSPSKTQKYILLVILKKILILLIMH